MTSQITDPAKLRLYHHPLSGHAHRAALFLSLLGLDHDLIEVDLLAGEHKTDAFLKLNPKGLVPVLIDGDKTIPESTAILIYLAAKYDDGTWAPKDPEQAAQVQRWFIESATDLANGVAAARLVKIFGAPRDLEAAQALGNAFLARLDGELARKPFLVADRPTIADIAIYSYVARSDEGGVSLAPYANVQAWLARIEALPRFTAMVKTPAKEQAA